MSVWSPDLERAVCGAVLLYPQLLDTLRALVSVDDFYDHRHRSVWEALAGVAAESRPIDHVSVVDWLRRHDRQVDALYLSQLTDGVSTSAHAERHARRVRLLSLQRKVGAEATRIAAAAEAEHDDVSGWIADAQRALSLVSCGDEQSYYPAGHLAHELIADTHNALIVPTGIIEIDNKIGGLPGGLLTVIAGRPGHGKSSVALSLAREACRRATVLYYSLEDDLRAQQTRLVSMESGVPYFDIFRRSNLSLEQHRAVALAVAGLRDRDIEFVTRRLSADEIAISATAAQSRHGGRLGLVVIDHLGYVRAVNHRATPYETATEHVHRFAWLAKELCCPLVVVAQLNRQVESQSDKRPSVSQLRDSGRIEEDARLIALVYRPRVYDERADHGIELIVGKNTNGATGTIRLGAQIECCRLGGAWNRY